MYQTNHKIKRTPCRFCLLSFCCISCREKHEVLDHQIEFPYCDICVYGAATLTKIQNAEEKILQHIVNNHCPLRCLFCNILFNQKDDLLVHTSCTGNQPKESSPYLPSTYERFNIVSSTPMIPNRPQNKILGASITPVSQNSAKTITPEDIKFKNPQNYKTPVAKPRLNGILKPILYVNSKEISSHAAIGSFHDESLENASLYTTCVSILEETSHEVPSNSTPISKSDIKQVKWNYKSFKTNKRILLELDESNNAKRFKPLDF